jgi:hypothetical protein
MTKAHRIFSGLIFSGLMMTALFGLAVDARAAAPGAGGSAAAEAKLAVSRGRRIGAACQPSDGYQPDWSKHEVRAAAQAAQMTKQNAKPLNLLDFAGPDAPPPLDRHQLPPGRAYCIVGDENPDGYLTSNCKTDADCPSPATCDGSLCRAGCVADSDCVAPTTCAPIAPGLRSCRHIGNLPGGQEVEPAGGPPRKATTAARKALRGRGDGRGR